MNIHVINIKKYGGFNTDDGIRRAAINELHWFRIFCRCFNTDDGIRRAAIIAGEFDNRVFVVSIPMTVLGGLQLAGCQQTAKARRVVSIPMTVLGGLQFAAFMRKQLRPLKFQYR